MKYTLTGLLHFSHTYSFASLLLSTCVLRIYVDANDSPTGPDISSDVLNRAQKIKGDGQKLGPCQVCKALVNSFEAGETATARGKFEGGDASWEESRLGSYNDSELRLIEIQESLCNDLSTGKDQCQYLAEEQESEIEFWWKNMKQKDIQLFDFLCIERMAVCCPAGTFGQNCAPCPGYPDNICSGKGKCKGEGTRKGSGKCQCNKEYFGEMCTKCAVGYYKVGENETTKIPHCQACHASCLGHCRDKGPKGCEVCKQGYLWDNDFGCMDIDECVELSHNPCKGNTFCVNTEGSHECFQCDKSCDGCNGDGPDMCYKCAKDFTKKENVCVDAKTEEKEKQMEVARYATYFGLCISTCIIFRKNIYLASVIGLLVAVYIAVAEYTVRGAEKDSFYDFMKRFVG